jgi:hypothetical protein
VSGSFFFHRNPLPIIRPARRCRWHVSAAGRPALPARVIARRRAPRSRRRRQCGLNWARTVTRATPNGSDWVDHLRGAVAPDVQDGFAQIRLGGFAAVAWRSGGVARTAATGRNWRPNDAHFDTATFGGVRRSSGLRPPLDFCAKQTADFVSHFCPAAQYYGGREVTLPTVQDPKEAQLGLPDHPLRSYLGGFLLGRVVQAQWGFLAERRLESTGQRSLRIGIPRKLGAYAAE